MRRQPHSICSPSTSGTASKSGDADTGELNTNSLTAKTKIALLRMDWADVDLQAIKFGKSSASFRAAVRAKLHYLPRLCRARNITTPTQDTFVRRKTMPQPKQPAKRAANEFKSFPPREKFDREKFTKAVDAGCKTGGDLLMLAPTRFPRRPAVVSVRPIVFPAR
jgi:hypothetical protein